MPTCAGNVRSWRQTGSGWPTVKTTRMSSGPEDFHLRALSRPYVNLSIHTAPIVRPFPWHSDAVGEELGIRSTEPVEPISCTLGLMAHPLELAACPPDDIDVNPLESGTQLRLVEMAVVGDPAANDRIVHLCHLCSGSVAAFVKRP